MSYNPYRRRVERKKDNFPTIFGWVYVLTMIMGYLVGWAIGGSIA